MPRRRPREVLDDAALDRDLLASSRAAAHRRGGIDHVAEPLEQGHVLAQLAQGVGRAVRRRVDGCVVARSAAAKLGGGFLFFGAASSFRPACCFAGGWVLRRGSEADC